MARRFPEAFWEGIEAASSHFKAVGEGRIAERPFPANPYPRPAEPLGEPTEWHAWNVGWNAGVADR